MWISVGSLILGVVATILVSRYYFRRSNEKSLTPYVQFSSSPFRGIDPGVRAALEIRYQGAPINHLYEIQFLIANTGEKAIRDIVEPLSLSIPENCSLLDATLLHVDPPGRKVAVVIASNRNKLSFDIPLLNRREFFIVKLLLNGEPKVADFVFNIAADELPPQLKVQPLPPDAVGIAKRKKFELGMLAGGAIMLSMGIGVATLIFEGFGKLPVLNVQHPWTFIVQLDWSNLALALSLIPSLVFVLIGAMLSVGSLTEGTFPPPKHRFIVPNERQLLRFRHAFRPNVMVGDEWND